MLSALPVRVFIHVKSVLQSIKYCIMLRLFFYVINITIMYAKLFSENSVNIEICCFLSQLLYISSIMGPLSSVYIAGLRDGDTHYRKWPLNFYPLT